MCYMENTDDHGVTCTSVSSDDNEEINTDWHVAANYCLLLTHRR